MAQFGAIFREERYYCNHFFRLLCERLSTSPEDSGLGKVLSLLSIPRQSLQAIEGAEIYTEVACFRDVFFAAEDKDRFLEELFDQFHPMLLEQYGPRIANAQRPARIRELLGRVHPSKYRDLIKQPRFDDCDVLFYRELGALFNAKPDILILLPDLAIWIEAKFSSAFSSFQIRRMSLIGALCEKELFANYFNHRQSYIVLLGSEVRHSKARIIEGCAFISWEKCASIAEQIFPAGRDDITSRALAFCAS
jgi:hypothetical protein